MINSELKSPKWPGQSAGSLGAAPETQVCRCLKTIKCTIFQMKKVHYGPEVSFFRKFTEQLKLEGAGVNQSPETMFLWQMWWNLSLQLTSVPAQKRRRLDRFLSREIHLVSNWLACLYNQPMTWRVLRFRKKKRTKIVMSKLCCKKSKMIVSIGIYECSGFIYKC